MVAARRLLDKSGGLLFYEATVYKEKKSQLL